MVKSIHYAGLRWEVTVHIGITLEVILPHGKEHYYFIYYSTHIFAISVSNSRNYIHNFENH